LNFENFDPAITYKFFYGIVLQIYITSIFDTEELRGTEPWENGQGKLLVAISGKMYLSYALICLWGNAGG